MSEGTSEPSPLPQAPETESHRPIQETLYHILMPYRDYAANICNYMGVMFTGSNLLRPAGEFLAQNILQVKYAQFLTEHPDFSINCMSTPEQILKGFIPGVILLLTAQVGDKMSQGPDLEYTV